MIDPSFEYDIAIVGAGLAGLCAGARAIELGAKVLVLEQGNGERYPCNSRASGGIFHVAYHDMKTAPDELAALLREKMPPGARDDVADALASNAARLVDWLAAHGTRYLRASLVDWHRWTAAPPRPLKPGLDFPGCGVDAILERLAGFLRAASGILATGHRVLAARRCGAGFELDIVRTDRSQLSARARRLVLADGGFQGAPELLRAHITPRPERTVTRGAGTGRGDGHRLAASLGGAIEPVDHFYGHLLSRDALHNPLLTPYPQLDALACAGFVVGPDAQRIADEGRGGVFMANALACLDDPASAVAIFDGRIWEETGRRSLYPPNPAVEEAGGTVLRAGNPQDLARAAGLPPEPLAATLSTYNAAMADGGACLAPPRSGRPAPILGSPLMAIPLCVGITHTMGGIVIDGRMRVLDTDGIAIPGLYAAGTTASGLDGGANVFYAGGLSMAGVSGLLAAEDALASVAGSKSTIAAPAPRKTTYPALALLARYGETASAAFGIAAAALAAWLSREAGTAGAAAAALLIGSGAYVLLRVLTDLVRLIQDVLLPER